MAERDWSWWYEAAPEGLLMSVSQFKLWLGCKKRWGYRHLLHLKEEMGGAAERGNKYHQEQEMWAKLGKMPTSKPALAAMRFAPAPGVAEAEVAVCYLFDGVPWIGFIDLVYDWEGELGRANGSIKPLCSTGHTVIHDWKFTGSLRNAMTEDELRADPAANLYALEAYMGGATRVSCRWVYVEMSGSSHPTKEVWVDMPLQAVAEVLMEMSDGARDPVQLVKLHKKGEVVVQEMETNTGECFAFRRNCPYKPGTEHTHLRIASGEIEGCSPTMRLGILAPKGESTMQDFKSALANFPGAGTKPAPALPGKPPAIPPKLPPKLPPKAAAPAAGGQDLSDAEIAALVGEQLAAQGKGTAYRSDPNPVVETGFVNSSAAPKTPPASPEEAAAMQGVKKPEPPKPAEDDLTPLNKDQLRGLCGQMGIDLSKKRPQEETLRGMIRIARIQAAAGATPAKPTVQEEIDSESTVISPEAQAAIRAAVERVDAAVELPGGSEAVISKPAPKLPPKASEKEPVFHPAVCELHVIMDAAHAKLHEEHKDHPRDYREIEFGRGGAALCLAVQDLYESCKLQSGVVIFDSSTPEGATLKTTLMALARAGRFVLVDGVKL